MFRFLKTRPKYEDEAFSDLSRMFFQLPDDPIFRSELLKKEALDFSVDSLKVVDDYLEAIRAVPPEGAAFQKVVLRAGAYVGEVIRKAGLEQDSHWIAYDEAARISPDTYGKLEKSMASIASLHHGGDAFTFPLGKVCKRLENGDEDSVWFFAKTIIAIRHEKMG
jgi:hypothetical protein